MNINLSSQFTIDVEFILKMMGDECRHKRKLRDKFEGKPSHQMLVDIEIFILKSQIERVIRDLKRQRKERKIWAKIN